MRKISHLIAIALVSGLLMVPPSARADHFIGDICRIKGQEENVLHGMGLVVGLKGTGDGDNKPTLRALGHYMELLGHRIGSSSQAQPMLDELKNVKNVALVYVVATIPPGGAQQGDSLDCTVSAIAAKSLDGGRLMLTELYGPLPGEKTVYALATGPISIDDAAKPQTGRIPLGCQLERKLENEFLKDGKLTLVLNKDHAAFQTTHDVEKAINDLPDLIQSSSTGQGNAKAIDQVKVEVTIPSIYADRPALFASLLLNTRLIPPQVDTRVIINERKQALIIGGDVEIGPVAVMHKNRLIQVGDQQINEAVEFNPRGVDSSKTKLASLVEALNQLKVPTADVIDIIKMLKHKRALYGELIIE
jgi:flagellar P-ring protein precursor FlgI